MAQCPHVHIDSCGVWAGVPCRSRDVHSNLTPIVSRGAACTRAQLLPAGGRGGREGSCSAPAGSAFLHTPARLADMWKSPLALKGRDQGKQPHSSPDSLIPTGPWKTPPWVWGHFPEPCLLGPNSLRAEHSKAPSGEASAGRSVMFPLRSSHLTPALALTEDSTSLLLDTKHQTTQTLLPQHHSLAIPDKKCHQASALE